MRRPDSFSFLLSSEFVLEFTDQGVVELVLFKQGAEVLLVSFLDVPQFLFQRNFATAGALRLFLPSFSLFLKPRCLCLQSLEFFAALLG